MTHAHARGGCACAWLALVLSGCGTSATQSSAPLPRDYLPRPIERGPAFALAAASPAVTKRAPIGGLRCATERGRFFGIHLELYAHRLVVPIPAGVGIAPPLQRHSVYVLGGRCAYPTRSYEPTGVFVVDKERGRPLQLASSSITCVGCRGSSSPPP